MIYAAYALHMCAALALGVAVGGYAARRAGPPPLFALYVLLLVALGLGGMGVVYAMDVPL